MSEQEHCMQVPTRLQLLLENSKSKRGITMSKNLRIISATGMVSLLIVNN